MKSYEEILNDARDVVKGNFETIKSYPRFAEIQKRLKRAEEKIDYRFSDVFYLPVIFCRTKIQPGKNNYMNETLAQLGDFVLDLVRAFRLLRAGKDKKNIARLRF